MPDVKDISHIAYDLYKTDWVNENTNAEMRMKSMQDYALDWLERFKLNGENARMEPYEDWLFENGYGQGSLYVCYQEFCDAEYHDKEYICSLLQDDELIALYYADINEDNEP